MNKFEKHFLTVGSRESGVGSGNPDFEELLTIHHSPLTTN
jgi:hypothetical protein